MTSSSEISTGFDNIVCGTVVRGVFWAMCRNKNGPFHIYAMDVAERKVFAPVEVSNIFFAMVKDCDHGAIFDGRIYVSLQSGSIVAETICDRTSTAVDHIPGLTVTVDLKINAGYRPLYGHSHFHILRDQQEVSTIKLFNSRGLIVEGGPLIHRHTGRIYFFGQEDIDDGPRLHVVNEDFKSCSEVELPPGNLALSDFKYYANQFWLSDNIIVLVSNLGWLKYNVETREIAGRGKMMNGREFKNCRPLYGRYIVSEYITSWCMFKVDTLRREKKLEYKNHLNGRTYGIDEVGGEVVFCSNMGKFMLVKTHFVNNGDAVLESDGMVLRSTGEIMAENGVVATVTGLSKVIQNSKSIVVAGKRLPIKDIKRTGRVWMRALQMVHESVQKRRESGRKGLVEHLRKRFQAMENMDIIQIDSIRKRAAGQVGLFPDIFRIVQEYIK